MWYVRDGDACFVTAVLVRASDTSPARLNLGPKAELEAEGELKISAAVVQVEGREGLELQGEELLVRARGGKALLGEFSVLAKGLFSSVTKTTLVGKVMETFVDRIQSRSKTSSRVVEDLDQLHAGNLEHRATGVAEIAGKHTLLGGGELVKADAGQIHLG